MPFGLSTVAVKAIGIGLLVLALMGLFAWFVHSEREIGAQQCQANVAAAQTAEHAKYVAETERNDQLSAQLIAAQAARKTTYATITRDVDHIVDRPVYRDVCLDADGVRDINAALAGKAVDSSGAASAVPAASPASGNHGG